MKKIVGILCIVFVLCILLLVMPSAAANVTATVSQSTVAHGDKIFINGTAEGQPNSVAIWILGTNFASRQTVAVNVDGSFSYEVTQQITEALNSGQYFVVVQHPEMNGVYDIDLCPTNPVGSIYVCDYAVGQGPVSVFKLSGPGSLQGFDAEEALVQGINKPYIDDTYTALQFQILSSSKIGIFRPSAGFWYLDYNKTGVVDNSFQFGKSEDLPVTIDWNGDGTSDIGVFRPSNGYWYIDTNKDGIVENAIKFGKSGDIPVVGDWDGNGISDIGVFRPVTGTWYLDTTKTGVVNKTFQFGKSGDIPVIGKWI